MDCTENEGINDIMKTFSQLLDQFDSQNKLLDKISEYHKQMLNAAENLGKNSSEMIQVANGENEGENVNGNENKNFEFSNVNCTFNMNKQTINCNGKSYTYDNEEMVSGKNEINKRIQKIEKEKSRFNYPQGIEYCFDLLNYQKNQDGSVIILSNLRIKQNFFFIFKDPNDLLFDEGKRITGSDNLAKELNLLKNSTANDIFPQGRNYCRILLIDQIKLPISGCVRSFLKRKKPHCYWYYFKSTCFDCPNKQKFTEKYFFYKGKDQCRKELEKISRESINRFPQGIDYCNKLIRKQNKAKDLFIVIEKKQEEETYWNYFTPKQFIDLASDTEIWLKSKNELEKELKKLNDQDFAKKANYPQGLEYCKSLIQTQIDNEGTIHFVTRESNCFYFKI